MNRNLIWKVLLIALLVVMAAWNLYPPHLKLKPGIDIGGGWSLIYEIDTSDLTRAEQKGLAQRMIPFLLKRVDPTNVANIVMTSQGDTRIEIKQPAAREDTKQKRRDYDDALKALEGMNVNIRKVMRDLKELDPEKRRAAFAEYASDPDPNSPRRKILEEVATAWDALHAGQARRDELDGARNALKVRMDEAYLRGDFVEAMAVSWSKMDAETLAAAIKRHVERNKPPREESDPNAVATDPNAITTDPNAPATDPNAVAPADDSAQREKLIADYITAHKEWADVANELAKPETGIRAQWNRAAAKLADLNLEVGQVTDVLEVEKPEKRDALIEELKKNFPDRTTQIEMAVEAHNVYRYVGGRLDDPEDLKRMLKGAGVLEFRILPTLGDNKSNASELEARREELKSKGPKLGSDAKYVWAEIENVADFREDAIIEQFGDKSYVLASNQKNECMLRDRKKPWKLKKAGPTSDDRGRRAISFSLDDAGSPMFFRVTRDNVGRPLCILLDGIAFSAPNVESAIRGSGVITGDFPQAEQEDMINKLNAGSFPARLSDVPISEKSIGSTIGADNRDKGIKAGLVGVAVVAAFMIFYYLLAGSIANVALFMNILFVLGMMAMLRATFTLPGIAGLILTIGMSVDANVLIFERIREEQDRGSSLRTAIANGYQRAFRTIFDANITTFFVALILRMVASEEIKGFAIVLMLGIASSMFTALFVTRVIFDLLLGSGIIRNRLVMLRLVRKPNINWMGLRKGFFCLSLLLITAGMFIFFTRDESKNSKYDIEFTGGTSAQITLKETEAPNFTRRLIEEMIRAKGGELGSDAIKVAKVYTVGEPVDDKDKPYFLEYEITTTATNTTTATVTFNETGRDDESVRVAIEEAMDAAGGRLYNLEVSGQDDKTFSVSTSQVNKTLVSNVLKAAFGDEVTVSDPVVDQIVNRAISEAFDGMLSKREDLGVSIVSAERIAEDTVELADFLGGVKIVVDLAQETAAGEIRDRVRETRSKVDAADLEWYGYNYEILSAELAELADADMVKRFVYVNVHSEAGYRELDEDEWGQFVDNEKEKITRAGSMQTTLARITQIDPSIGAQAKTRALIAIILSLIVIIAYIWIRFGTARYGFAAIAALVHDVCITLGAVTVCTYIAGKPIGNALLLGDFKIDLQMIAAFLTIIGYSLNDTIVVFDRIRENRGKLATVNPQIISNSINQTLSRTLLTSVTTFAVVLVMYIWGGTGLRGFTFAMLVGIIVGTYSSIAIAAPILLLGAKKQTAKLKK